MYCKENDITIISSFLHGLFLQKIANIDYKSVFKHIANANCIFEPECAVDRFKSALLYITGASHSSRTDLGFI